MRREQLALHYDVGARRAQVGRRAIVFAVTAKQLILNRSGKILVECHAGRIFTVQHHATIARRPAWSTRALFAHEPVLNSQSIVRIGLVGEEMAELFIVLFVFIFVVANFQQAVLDAKCVPIVFAQRVMADLGTPTVQVFTVEQLNPVGRLGFLSDPLLERDKTQKQGEKRWQDAVFPCRTPLFMTTRSLNFSHDSPIFDESFGGRTRR